MTMKLRLAAALGAAALAGLVASGAYAAENEVRMLNRGAAGAMVFEPQIVRAAPGDTIRFVATDKGHNAETIKGMVPEGAEPFAGKLNEEIAVTLDTEGVYGVRCKPHYGLGMVMLIQVGEPVNAEAAKAAKSPKKAKARFDTLFAELEGK